MKSKFIYFDLGNVLLSFSHETACRNMAALAGVTAEQVRTAVFDSALELAYERGDLSSREFYEQFCTVTGRRPDFDALCLAASDMFAEVEPVVALVKQLRDRGLRLGILSNTCDAHWQFCLDRFRHVTDLFPVHALSFRLRALKPEARIYRGAAELAGVAPGEIFFTDDRHENVQAAVEAGFDAVLFQSAAQLTDALRQRQLVV
jgi:glucose-1-phosphatase